MWYISRLIGNDSGAFFSDVEGGRYEVTDRVTGAKEVVDYNKVIELLPLGAVFYDNKWFIGVVTKADLVLWSMIDDIYISGRQTSNAYVNRSVLIQGKCYFIYDMDTFTILSYINKAGLTEEGFYLNFNNCRVLYKCDIRKFNIFRSKLKVINGVHK